MPLRFAFLVFFFLPSAFAGEPLLTQTAIAKDLQESAKQSEHVQEILAFEVSSASPLDIRSVLIELIRATADLGSSALTEFCHAAKMSDQDCGKAIEEGYLASISLRPYVLEMLSLTAEGYLDFVEPDATIKAGLLNTAFGIENLLLATDSTQDVYNFEVTDPNGFILDLLISAESKRAIYIRRNR